MLAPAMMAANGNPQPLTRRSGTAGKWVSVRESASEFAVQRLIAWSHSERCE